MSIGSRMIVSKRGSDMTGNRTKPKRGRPAGQMTPRRRQVLGHLADCAAAGQRITLGQLVRSCGIYQREDAKRILRDLRRLRMDVNFSVLPAGIGV